jgi:hypothetical protein
MINAAGDRVDCGGEKRVSVQHSACVVLECSCGERLAIAGPVSVRRSGRVLQCDCGEKFTLTGRMSILEHDDVTGHQQRRYSWLRDCLERLEGKEARQEYYVRLEHAAS